MPTVKVDNFHRFKNCFSSYGRATNDLYRELNKNGCNYILERPLPDKSKVISAYKNETAKSSDYVIKINPDGSMEQKTNSVTGYIFSFVTGKIRVITKIFANKEGKKTDEYIKRITYNKKNEVTRQERFHHTDKYVTHYENDKYGNEVMESFTKTAMDGSGNEYKYVLDKDGTKTFTRRINGVDYFFTTKK